RGSSGASGTKNVSPVQSGPTTSTTPGSTPGTGTGPGSPNMGGPGH
ncbi:MAG: DUF4349 domain-containing protein, partial [Deltaproteobacteria bacterium]|nr:DUF4349 domain-containing protein [Deltaproteobacteria bacterium]